MQSFIMGSYAPKGTASLFELAFENGRLTVTAENTQAENPSYLYLHPNRNVLYAVEECVPNGRVVVFQRQNDKWQLTERLAAGSSPCHLEMDAMGRYLFVSNYMDGSISVYRMNGDGLCLQPCACIRHYGHGSDPNRQEGPHMHACLCVDNLLYAADLGLDTVFVYDIDQIENNPQPIQEIRFPSGCGVRHMAMHPLHPECLYVNAEMGGRIFTVNRASGEILQSFSVVENPQELFATSAVKISDDLLCVATRGWNQLAMFRVLQSGLLAPIGITALQDDFPRDLYFDGKQVLLANQGSKTVSCLRCESGNEWVLADRIGLHQASPTCLIAVQ